MQEYKLMATTPLRDLWLPSLTLLHNKQTRKRDVTYVGYALQKKTANQRSTATNVNEAFAANTALVYAINVENRKHLQWLPTSN